MKRYAIEMVAKGTFTLEIDASSWEEAEEIAYDLIQHEDIDLEYEIVDYYDTTPKEDSWE
jgi:DNA primase large subunit